MSKILGIIIAVIVGLLTIFGLTDIQGTLSQIWDEITGNYYEETVEVPGPVLDSEEIPSIKEDTVSETDPVIDDQTQKYDPEEDVYVSEIYFGHLIMTQPSGYSISSEVYEDGTYVVYGQNYRTGGEFEIYNTLPNGYTAISQLEDLSGEFDGAAIEKINGVPCIIIYDEENDVDICICADQAEASLSIIAFNRPDGENTGMEYFQTINALVLDE